MELNKLMTELENKKSAINSSKEWVTFMQNRKGVVSDKKDGLFNKRQ